jgi:hypothetical protein
LLDGPLNLSKYADAKNQLVADHIDVTDYVVREIDALFDSRR